MTTFETLFHTSGCHHCKVPILNTKTTRGEGTCGYYVVACLIHLHYAVNKYAIDWLIERETELYRQVGTSERSEGWGRVNCMSGVIYF